MNLHSQGLIYEVAAMIHFLDTDEGKEIAKKNLGVIGIKGIAITALGYGKLDKNGKVIKAKEKIPPLVFKKTYYRVLIKSYGGSEDIYYDGWAEDYPKDPSTLKKIY